MMTFTDGFSNSIVVSLIIGMSYKPSSLLRVPYKITLLSLMMCKWLLFNTAVQLSSQSCPMEIREEFTSAGKTAVAVALGESSGTGNAPILFDWIILLFGRCTDV